MAGSSKADRKAQLNALSPEHKLKYLLKKNNEGKLVETVKSLFNDDAITAKFEFLTQCLQLLEQDTLINQVLSELSGVLVTHVPHLEVSELKTLGQWFLDAVKQDRILSGKSLEVLGKLLIHMDHVTDEDDDEFVRSNYLHQICTVRWSPRCIIPIITTVRDLNLSDVELQILLDKTIGSLKTVAPAELPQHIYHLLLASNKGSYKRVLAGIIEHFDKLDTQITNQETEDLEQRCDIDTDELCQAEGTSLLHLMFAIKHDLELGKALNQYLKSIRRYTPFSLALALSFVQHTRFSDNVLATLKSGICKTLKTKKMWETSKFVHDLLEAPSDITQVLESVIVKSNMTWDYVTEGLVKLAFILLDSTSNEDVDIRDVGVFILERCYKLHTHCKTSVLTQLLHRMITSTPLQDAKHQHLLHSISRHSLQLMLAQSNMLKDNLSNVPLIPVPNAEAVLQAVVPIMRYNTALRDYAITVFRKSLFSKEPNTRKIAVIGLTEMMKKFKVGEMYSQSSQLSCSQVAVHMMVTDDLNEAICTEILLLLKRALLQQGDIRSLVYEGLADVINKNYKLYPMIIQLLHQQITPLYEPDQGILPPLKITACINVLPDHAVLREPLPDLLKTLFTCANVVRVKDPDAVESLEEMLESIVLRSCKSDMEDWDVDKTSEFTASGAGSRNLITALTLSAVLQVLLENVIVRGRCGVEDGTTLKKLFSMFHSVQELINEKQSGAGRFGRARNTPPPYFSLVAVNKLLYQLIVDEYSEHEGYVSLLRTISHLLTWVLNVLSDHIKLLTGGDYKKHSSKEMCNMLGTISRSLLLHLHKPRSLYRDQVSGLFNKAAGIVSTFYSDKIEEYLDIVLDFDKDTTLPTQLYTLLDRAIENEDYTESQHLLSSISLFQQVSDQTELYKWTKAQLNNGSHNAALSKDLVSLFLSTSRATDWTLTVHLKLAQDAVCTLGDIEREDEDSIDSTVTHSIVKDTSATRIVLALVLALDKVLQDVEWCIQLGCTENQADALCLYLVDVANVLCPLLTVKTPHGTAAVDQVTRTVKHFYNTFSSFAKHETAALAKRATLRSLEKLAKLVGSTLSPKLYNFLIYLEQPYEAHKGKKNAAAIRKQTISVPSMVYAVEQCERNLIVLSTKSKTVDLMEHFKRSTARDFRIQTGVLEQKFSNKETTQGS